MQIEPMKGLEDVLLIKPDLHEDDRGYFYEVFNEREFNEKTGNKYNFHALQENESKSSKFVFRGLHFQNPPYEQAKLVRVLKGAVVDFAVDIRKDSPTFGKSVDVLLTDGDKYQFFIPRGFAHGFIVVTDKAVFEYKCDNYYNKESEDGLRFDGEGIERVRLADSFSDTSFLEHLEDLLSLYAPADIIAKIEGRDELLDLLVLSEKDKNRTTTLKDL